MAGRVPRPHEKAVPRSQTGRERPCHQAKAHPHMAVQAVDHADTAAEIVQRCHPDLVVPMHYRDGAAGFDVISTVQPFLDHFDTVVRHDQTSFRLGEFHDTLLVLKNPKL